MSLEDSLNTEFAEGWRPNPGDMLIGEVTEISSRDGAWGPYRIITIRRDDGERLAVHAFHQILVDELRKIRPQVGHRIGIKYVGRPEGKNYDVYRCATENPPTEDWSDQDPSGPSEFQSPPPVQGGFVPAGEPVASGTAKADGSDVPF